LEAGYNGPNFLIRGTRMPISFDPFFFSLGDHSHQSSGFSPSTATFLLALFLDTAAYRTLFICLEKYVAALWPHL